MATLAIPTRGTMKTKVKKGQREYAVVFWQWYIYERNRRKMSDQAVSDAAIASGFDDAMTRGALQRASTVYSDIDVRVLLTISYGFGMQIWQVASKTGLFGEQVPAGVVDGNSTLAELISNARKMSIDELRVLIIAQNTILEQRRRRPRT